MIVEIRGNKNDSKVNQDAEKKRNQVGSEFYLLKISSKTRYIVQFSYRAFSSRFEAFGMIPDMTKIDR